LYPKETDQDEQNISDSIMVVAQQNNLLC